MTKKKLSGLYGRMIVGGGLFMVALLAVEARADGTALAQRQDQPAGKSELDREATALAFVQEHHAELDGLLAYLRENRSPEYNQAIQELYRASERLGQIRKRDVPRYALELKAWKLRSRIQLLTARWMMERSEALEHELLDAIQSQHDLRIELLQMERSGIEERLEKLNQQVERMEQNRSQIIDRQLATILRGTPSAGRPKQAAKTEASKKKPVKGKQNKK